MKQSEVSPLTMSRRHDLDALRAIAMLLGIGLHGALSFMPLPWPVQDSQQSEFFGLFLAAIHGFRMQLFFLVSGFFTAMLWRKRGLKSLATHRFKRVFLPCLLGLVTIVPVATAISWVAIASGPKQVSVAGEVGAWRKIDGTIDLWSAVISQDFDAMKKHLADGADIEALDKTLKLTPLMFSGAYGNEKVTKYLLENGADVNGQSGDKGTALHLAAVFGHIEVANVLLAHGAKTNIRNVYTATAADNLKVGWELTEYVAGYYKLELDQQKVMAGRKKIEEMLKQNSLMNGENQNRESEMVAAELVGTVGLVEEGGFVDDVVRFTSKPIFTWPVFHHLWFLWYLCWLVAGFIGWVALAGCVGLKGIGGRWGWLVTSPIRYVWLIGLVLVPQWFMGRGMPSFGPDTGAGVLPIPQVLIYYGVFFGFGALYYDANDVKGELGKWWRVTLPAAIIILLPLGLEFTYGGVLGIRDEVDARWHKLIGDVLQVSYAWLMTFGCMGLFRKLLSKENKTMRYVSDSSYWLYLAHLPLIIGAQLLVRDWAIPSFVKFVLICVVVSGILIWSYEYLVRYRWLGAFLNGRKIRVVVKEEDEE